MIRSSDIHARLAALELTEDDALALIEKSGRVSDSRNPDPRLEAIAARDPELAGWIRATAADRATLAALPDPAPPDPQRVWSALCDAGVGSVEPPVTLSDLRRVAAPRVASPIPWSRVWRLAIWAGGAGALVAAGLGIAALVPILGRALAPTPAPPIIAHAEPVEARSPDIGVAETQPVSAARAADSRDAAEAPRTLPALAAALDGPEWFLSADRAAELARVGRLGIRLRTAEPDATEARLAALSGDRGLTAPAWRVALDADAAVMSAARASFARDAAPTVEPLILASDQPGVFAELPEPHAAPGPERVVLADARAEGPALASLLAALSQGGRQRAVFELLPTAFDAGESLDAAGALWWTEPPERWGSPRVWVPVVVEPVSPPGR